MGEGGGAGRRAHRRRSFCDTRRSLRRRFVAGGSVGRVAVLGMGC